ncbi:MAG: type II secretion system protein [Candidatus Goldiibacteriota bacterium]
MKTGMFTAGNTVRGNRGFSYLVFLIAAAVICVITAGAGMVFVSRVVKAENEQELIFRGLAYKKGIESYYNAAAGRKKYPESLDELVNDRRFFSGRHIRKLYTDPFDSGEGWLLIRSEHGGIKGVVSRSKEESLKRAGFPDELKEFEDARSYSEWVFVYEP